MTEKGPLLVMDAPSGWDATEDHLLELIKRFERTGDVVVLTQATRLAERQVTAVWSDALAEASERYSALLHVLYAHTGDTALLTTSVTAARKAVAALPSRHSDRIDLLASLAATLMRRFQVEGRLDDLRESAELSGKVVEATGPEDSRLASRLGDLAEALRLLALFTGNAGRLAEAIAAGRRACDVATEDDPQKPHYLGVLGLALRNHFDRTADVPALYEAVALLRDAAEQERRGDDARSQRLASLGSALMVLAEWTGSADLRAESLGLLRECVAITSGTHPDRGEHLLSLGSMLGTSFVREGELARLDEAISVLREAVAAVPDEHPRRPSYLGDLGLALRLRYEWTGELAPLTEATRVLERAARSLPSGHDERPLTLGALGTALHLLGVRTGDTASLWAAVAASREAVRASPTGHPDRPGLQGMLGGALQVLAEREERWDLLDEALRVGRAAVDGGDVDPARQGGRLSNLANGLRLHAARTGEAGAAAEAVEMAQRAVAAVSDENPMRAAYLFNLGQALLELHRLDPAAETLERARRELHRAAVSDPAEAGIRLGAHWRSGHAAMLAGDAAGAVDAYAEAIALLPRVSPRSLARFDREHRLGDATGLTADAAAAALAAGDPERAVVLLEQARGTLLGEAIDAHAGANRLRSEHPPLAREYDRLRADVTEVEQAAGVPERNPEMAGTFGRRLRELDERWEALLRRIRAEPGLADFLRPPTISDLRAHAAHGPIAIVNVSAHRSDAVIVTPGPGDLRTTPLDLSPQVAYAMLDEIAAVHDGVADGSVAHAQAVVRVGRVLSSLWTGVASPVLSAAGIDRAPRSPAPAADLPRLWWCPIGMMALLPLHAAGTYADEHDPGRPADSVLDRAVSSYIPLLRALGYARRNRADSRQEPPSALVVAVAEAPEPHMAALRTATKEAERVTALIPRAETLNDADATHDAVLSALPRHPIVHFACHGRPEPNAPSRSTLMLLDHRAAPLTVLEVSGLRLSTARLAYLSSCSTAYTGVRLADEAIHIVAAFQLAGYQNVVGALWPIGDPIALRIATAFYQGLSPGEGLAPDPERSALALHDAVVRLRARTGNPLAWAAHVHAGV
ncbi:CHAT domain-containing protein [Actinomadura pelletieri DSM 43383]|uniref:CHAT domain-containing protein n=1 Tax=Actinomadura pelletieri DSM 43383 TaxID=1120940 RepID=A0A495QMU7_9ACTN|nr:CHAT domain-containing protein [Actinomadura pelletieri]RKS74305.1 CHAT domain-containing protein [Actinomadura pelletieri DSM 43383]